VTAGIILMTADDATERSACQPTATPARSPAGRPPQLDSSCGATDVDATTGIAVVLWQPRDSGQAIYVRQVTADYYGTKVTHHGERRGDVVAMRWGNA
jgi:hypothetical protein